MGVKLQAQGVWVVIPASGVGSRMRSKTPKQYISLHGKTILEHTISRFSRLQGVAGILVVISESDQYWADIKQPLVDRYQSRGVLVRSTFGGKERSDTVRKGLSFLLEQQQLSTTQWVMVHDAARPCVREVDILELLAVGSKKTEGGAILATPVKDTLKLANSNNNVLKTQSRESLWQAQTPQLFRLGDLLKALLEAKHAGIVVTDEASAIEYSGSSVQLVEGSSDNIKLTDPADLKIIDFLLTNIEKNNGL